MRPRSFPLRILTPTTIALSLLTLGTTPAQAAPPTIPLTTASGVSTDSATLEADINPQGKAGFYYFEYGLAPCSSNPCTKTPVPSGELKKSEANLRVKAPIEGLTPGTTYHFRAVASTPEGEAKGLDRSFTTLILPPPFGPCPNDLLRAGPSGEGPSLALPDCRAYERASPKDKNGVSLIGEPVPLRTSLSGDRIVFETSSGIPGAEGAQNYPYYQATRGKEDWSTQGLLPHGKAGDEAKVTGWSRDLSTSYSMAEISSTKERTFLARSSKDGTLETIVDYTKLGNVKETPLLPGTFFYAGAATDGSTVYLEATGPQQGDLSDKAAFNRNNLYAWERATDELHLAGVLPDGSTPPGGSLAGPYDWAKGTDKATLATGGALRRYYTQDNHAVSEDGKRVFFTAGDTGQLYLREEATEPTAETLHVSKSQKTNGKGPNKTDAAGTRPAAFMAATPEGSHAFFTSSEKLTNDATTGPEPDIFAAIARAPADDGDPLEIGCLPTSADWVDVDSTHIYWTDTEAGTIGRADLGCDKESIEANFIALPEIEIEKEPTKEPGVLTPSPPNPQDLAVGATHIYWTNATDGKKGTGTVGRVEIDGDDLKAECVKGASNPMGIDVNATDVYWANPVQINNNRGTIGRAKPDCTGANQEAIKMASFAFNSAPKGLELGATQIYWTMSQFALPEDFAYVVRRSFDGAEEQFTFIGTTPARGLAVNSTHVFWADVDDDSIGRAKLDFTDVDEKFIEGAGAPIGLAVNDDHVYWTANQEVPANPGNDLYRYEPETGELVDLVGGGPAPNGAEVKALLGTSEDGSRAYFAANGVLTATPNPQGDVATKGDCKGSALEGSGECNLYLWEEGVAGFRFVARLQAEGGIATSDALNWAPTTLGATVGRTEKTSRTSADGGVLLFRSQAQLSDYENAGIPEFYRYDAEEDSLLCPTCSPTGVLPAAAPTLGSIIAYLPGSSSGPPAPLQTRNLSADGNRLFFETTEALVAEDTNGLEGCPTFEAGSNSFPSCQDAYMWEASGEGSCESQAQNGGCLYLLSTGTDPQPSFFADASASGKDAFLITSRQGLVPEDQDQLFDVYDARVEGGLASQNQPPKPICLAEVCKPIPTPAPQAESPGTAGFQGPSDPTNARKPRPRCPKGKRKARVKGKVRCLGKRSRRVGKEEQGHRSRQQ
jgi:hypothetical protein